VTITPPAPDTAACHGHPLGPDAWDLSATPEQVTAATRVCWTTCPARQRCLDWAVATRITGMVCGGMRFTDRGQPEPPARCLECGDRFVRAFGSTAEICTQACRRTREARQARARQRTNTSPPKPKRQPRPRTPLDPRQCAACEATFTPVQPHQRACSNRCGIRLRRNRARDTAAQHQLRARQRAELTAARHAVTA
jgi:predicted nucleic acid-binding Zn ribbon protein